MYDNILQQSPDSSKGKSNHYVGIGGEQEHNEDEEEDNIHGLYPNYENLKVLWLNELQSPELLPWDDNTFTSMTQLLTVCHEDILPELRSQARHQGRSNSVGVVDPTLASLAAGICQMDADRVAFMLADLARIRMFKIEKYALHNREVMDRMSNLESQYLKSYGELWELHMKRNVTDHLPKEVWKTLDEPEMIDHPDLDSFVFCKVVDREGVLLDKYKDFSDELGDDSDRIPELYIEGSCLFLRYSLVRDLLSEGKVILLM